MVPRVLLTYGASAPVSSDLEPVNKPNLALARPEDISLPPSPPLDGLPEIQDEGSAETPPITSPETPDRAVSPLTAQPANNLSPQLSSRPRAQSPSFRGHMRSQSSSSPSVPLMQRAHSSPGVDSTGRFILPMISGPRRPASPSYSGRRRSPLRSAMEEPYPSTPTWSGLNIEPNIPEHAELDISTTLPPLATVAEGELYQPAPSTSFHNTFPRARRRPASPLHQSISTLHPLHPSASAPALQTTAPSPTSPFAGSSPVLQAQRYTNEPYPHYSYSSASSMPSTPTSLRSRSPSISSLETIPDTPDAEEAARIEAEELAKLRTVAGLEDVESKRRTAGFGAKKERKRWSVCGAERRADFSLEPIEE